MVCVEVRKQDSIQIRRDAVRRHRRGPSQRTDAVTQHGVGEDPCAVELYEDGRVPDPRECRCRFAVFLSRGQRPSIAAGGPLRSRVFDQECDRIVCCRASGDARPVQPEFGFTAHFPAIIDPVTGPE